MRDDELLGISDRAVRKPYGVDIRMVALTIADFGTNGFNCFPSVSAIADLIGCSDKTVEKCRQQLIELGWFEVASRRGGSNHRSLVLNINIPERKRDHGEVIAEAALSAALDARGLERPNGWAEARAR
jgi:hypothetical protein